MCGLLDISDRRMSCRHRRPGLSPRRLTTVLCRPERSVDPRSAVANSNSKDAIGGSDFRDYGVGYTVGTAGRLTEENGTLPRPHRQDRRHNGSSKTIDPARWGQQGQSRLPKNTEIVAHLVERDESDGLEASRAAGARAVRVADLGRRPENRRRQKRSAIVVGLGDGEFFAHRIFPRS